MADNINILDSTSGTKTIGTLESTGSVHFQKFLLVSSSGGLIPAIVDPAHGSTDDAYGPVKIGGHANAAAPTAVDENDRVNASYDLQGRQRVVQDAGFSLWKSVDLDESEEEVKDTAGRIVFLHIANLSTSRRYVKFFDADADDVTIGVTAPSWTLPWEPGTAGWASLPEGGASFANAITLAATVNLASTDTGAPGANEVVVNLGYK